VRLGRFGDGWGNDTMVEVRVGVSECYVVGVAAADPKTQP